MIAIFRKEFNEFLNSFIAYIVLAVFLVATGLVLWVFPDTSVLNYSYASLEPMFTLGPYLFMFLIPAITMRSFAEEKRTGTIELLFTLPFKERDIVLGKYFASVTLIFFSLIPTLIYYVSVYQLGSPEGNLDTPGIIGSYIGLFLLGNVFAAIGLFASSITENQIISFVISALTCFLLYDGLDIIAQIDVWGSFSYFLQFLGIRIHYDVLSKGLLDFRDISYFLGLIALFLGLVVQMLRNKR